MIVVFEVNGELRFMDFPQDRIEEANITGFIQIPQTNSGTYAILNKDKILGFFANADDVARCLFLGNMAKATTDAIVEEKTEQALSVSTPRKG